ncbi:MAG TPA: MBL fold metallo-hydrolase [Acidimicrobiales bacterium]|nr:MBL fold metallo-hydrolase [Acidimicrobiales bacterium]
MQDSYRAVGDVYVLPSSQASAGHGVLPVNAYLVVGRGPLLVDTGLPDEGEELLESVGSLVDLEDLAGVFLTHEDADHAGNLLRLLEAAPNARLVTNYVTVTKLLESTSVPLDRVVVVNPGQRVPGVDGNLVVIRPPVYDAPGTVGLYDGDTGAMLTVDAFGTYLPEVVDEVWDVGEPEALSGLFDFNRVNHPWVALADPARFLEELEDLRRLQPALLLSSHGVPARNRIDALFDAMARLPAMEPLVPPDQARFEELRPDMG